MLLWRRKNFLQAPSAHICQMATINNHLLLFNFPLDQCHTKDDQLLDYHRAK